VLVVGAKLNPALVLHFSLFLCAAARANPTDHDLDYARVYCNTHPRLRNPFLLPTVLLIDLRPVWQRVLQSTHDVPFAEVVVLVAVPVPAAAKRERDARRTPQQQWWPK
jgi:hypothetical protein